MSKFNTVTEVTHWKAFTNSGLTYNLSHLNAHHVEYQDSNDSKDIIYRFIVTYGMHCFTKGIEGDLSPDQQSLMYYGPKENRPFDFERYEQSKRLPTVIEDPGNPDTLVIHATYGKYPCFVTLRDKGLKPSFCRSNLILDSGEDNVNSLPFRRVTKQGYSQSLAI